MKKKNPFRTVNLRRLVQVTSVLLFLWLLAGATLVATAGAEGTRTPVKWFFYLDPLVLFSSWLEGGAIPALLFLSLLTILVALVFGRFFCGWVCPLGAIHNFFTWLRPGKKKTLMESGKWSRSQNAKYYLLVVLVVAALLGMNWFGVFAPISFLYRSVALVVYPAFQAGTSALFGWLRDADPVGVSAVSEPIYQSVWNNVLAFDQPHYAGTLLVALLFIFAVGMNLVRPRFWCRTICPLGATLGVCSNYNALKLKKVPEQCGGCNLCVAQCQGGADPMSDGQWRASECFYCWNCKDVCPSGAIQFEFELPSVRFADPRRVWEARKAAAAAKGKGGRGAAQAAEAASADGGAQEDHHG